ncbi:MAG TPA: maleylpyruvate isomerase N-terminal domain-containing protein [Cryptosporangiaceae bacterium]|nr:maleylpyruvate isomerase N-terminal domain-containing protein [Cryptosporangiaceae bacterium]
MAPSVYDLPAAVANVPLSHARLEQTLYCLGEEDLREPSVLPRWTRGHVATHVARHADAMVRLVTSTLTNSPAEQYPGGRDARDAEIEAGADRPLEEIIDDVAGANASVVMAFARMTAPTWAREVQFLQGRYPASRCAWARWREVEVHHVDLGLDMYTIHNWPEEFISCHLPHELAKLPSRLAADTAIKVGASRFGSGDVLATVDGPEPALLAWLFGRAGLAAPHLRSSTGTPPDLPTWG